MSIRTARSSKRLIAAAVAVAVTASTFAISNTAGAAGTTAAPAATRIDGANRYDTAAKAALSIRTNAGTVTTGGDAILVSGQSFSDGLAAAGLAGHIGGNVVTLLTAPTALSAETAAALSAIKPANLHVVGGTSAVAAAVVDAVVAAAAADALWTLATPVRYAGDNRFETAAAVATVTGNNWKDDTAILATGDNFADALAAGSLAFNGPHPILLHSGATLRADVAAAINDAGITDVVIAGGTAAIPASVETELKAILGATKVTRVAGTDRYDTAAKLAEAQITDAGADPTKFIVVSGENFPDALAAAQLSDGGTPILLTRAGSIPAPTAALHVKYRDALTDLVVVGGTSVVSAAVASGALEAATALRPTLTSVTYAAAAVSPLTFELANTSGSNITLSAVAGGPAAGLSGNGWKVIVSSITAASTAVSVVAGAKTISIALKAGEATNNDLRTALQSPAVASIFTVIPQGILAGNAVVGNDDLAVTTTYTFTANVSGNLATPASGSASPAASLVNSSGVALAAGYALTAGTYVDASATAPAKMTWTISTTSLAIPAGTQLSLAANSIQSQGGLANLAVTVAVSAAS